MKGPWEQLLGRLYEPLLAQRVAAKTPRSMGEYAFRLITSVSPELLYDEATATYHYRELLRERRGQT